MEVGAGAFLIVACTFVLLWPMLGAETNVFLRLPSEMEACKGTADPATAPGLPYARLSALLGPR